MQSRTMSFVESITNVVIGFIVAFSAQIIVFPFFDIHASINDNLQIAAIFTAISITRSYLIRRLFNNYIK